MVTTSTTLSDIFWTPTQLPKALQFIAQAYELAAQNAPDILQPTQTPLAEWLPNLAQQWHLEARAADVSYHDMLALLRQPSAAIIPLSPVECLVVLRGGRWRVTILRADGTRQQMALRTLRTMIYAQIQPTTSPPLDDILSVDRGRQDRLNTILQDEYLQEVIVPQVWRLHVDWQTQPMNWQLRQSGLFRALGGLFVLDFVSFLTFFLALLLISQSVVVLPLAWGILLAGLAVWLVDIPRGIMIAWLLRRVALRLGVLFKVQLFGGLQQLSPDEIAKHGTGHWLELALQSDQFLDSWLNRGPWFLYSLIFLVFSALMLLLSGAFLLSLVLVVWVGVTLAWVAYTVARHDKLQRTHRDYTARQLERLLGHATRRVQETDWFTRDDQATATYLREAYQQDRRYTALWMVVPYGALLLILGAIAVDLVPLGVPFGSSTVPAFQLAIVLLLLSQLQYLAISVPDVAQMITAWRQTRSLRQPKPVPTPTVSSAAIAPLPGRPFIEMQDIVFGYDADRLVLERCSAVIHAGDQILLRGESGAGKTTLAQLLSGLRPTQRGLLLMHGYDWHTIGTTEWRSQVVLAPQFYQNHIFDASLAFNLLMGRAWPATEADLTEAEALCRELGLGNLLDSMPQGMQQMVGSQGWQLSHGERNRVFVARALLQPAALLILDESLAALDPDSVQAVMACVRRRADTLLVITQEEA